MTKQKSSTSARGKAPAKKKRSAKTKVERPNILVLGHIDDQLHLAGANKLQADSRGEEASIRIEKAEVHGIILTGGGDVDPSVYGDKRHPMTQFADHDRDLGEMMALEAAAEKGIPVLGICRGSQMLNAYYGGKLHQHLPALKWVTEQHLGGMHKVSAVEGSRVGGAFKDKARSCITLHHQAVSEVAPGFVATAWSGDGVIEAIESVEGWMVGVQFHPEMSSGPGMQELFRALVLAAAKHAGMPPPSTRKAVVVPQTQYHSRDWDEDSFVERARRQHVIGARRDRMQTFDRPVLSTWRCFRCGIDFDAREDHLDHMLLLHDVDLRNGTTATVEDVFESDWEWFEDEDDDEGDRDVLSADRDVPDGAA